jgi:hypothetical protein
MSEKKKRKLGKMKQDKALKIALSLVEDYVTPRELEDSLHQLIGEKNIAKIAIAINPKAKVLEELAPWIEQEKAIAAKLDVKGKLLFNKYEADWNDRDYFRSIANFYLGFAAGLQLGGNRP